LTLYCDTLLSTSAFKFNLRRYTVGQATDPARRRRRRRGARQGRPVQVDPVKPTLKGPRTKRLKLRFYGPVSNFAFKFKLRRYIKAPRVKAQVDIGMACQILIATSSSAHFKPSRFLC